MYHHAVCKKFGLFLAKFQNKKRRKEENVILFLYNYIYCLRFMSWFTFRFVCVCDSFLHFSIAGPKKKKLTTEFFLACLLWFPKWGNLPFDISLIMHTYARGCTCMDDIWKKQFSAMSSRALNWEKHTEYTS